MCIWHFLRGCDRRNLRICFGWKSEDKVHHREEGMAERMALWWQSKRLVTLHPDSGKRSRWVVVSSSLSLSYSPTPLSPVCVKVPPTFSARLLSSIKPLRKRPCRPVMCLLGDSKSCQADNDDEPSQSVSRGGDNGRESM